MLNKRHPFRSNRRWGPTTTKNERRFYDNQLLNTTLARILSVVLHPLLMPTLLFGILLFQVPAVVGVDAFTTPLRLSLLSLIAVGTFGLPALLIFLLYRAGYLRNLTLDDRADRHLPYLLTGLVYSGLTYLFARRMQLVSEVAPEISVVLGSITISILLVALISLSWKISAHGVGIGGALGALVGIMGKFGETDLFWIVLAFVLLTGLLASARLHLNAHTPAQISAGLGLGLLVSLSAVIGLV